MNTLTILMTNRGSDHSWSGLEKDHRNTEKGYQRIYVLGKRHTALELHFQSFRLGLS